VGPPEEIKCVQKAKETCLEFSRYVGLTSKHKVQALLDELTWTFNRICKSVLFLWGSSNHCTLTEPLVCRLDFHLSPSENAKGTITLSVESANVFFPLPYNFCMVQPLIHLVPASKHTTSSLKFILPFLCVTTRSEVFMHVFFMKGKTLAQAGI